MGEIADMMLEGTLCAGCGVYIGEGDNDYPTYCEGCKESGNDPVNHKLEKIKCPKCFRKLGGQQGLDAHIKSKHPMCLSEIIKTLKKEGV